MSVVDIDRREAQAAADDDEYGYSAAQWDPPDPREYEDTWGWPNARRVIR